MTTDFRALCARMADELDRYRQLLMDDRREVHPLAAEARTALAEPRPLITDRELLEIRDSAYEPSVEALMDDDDDDPSFQFTSAYYRWLEENPEAMEAHEAKGLRAVFKAGIRWGQ